MRPCSTRSPCGRAALALLCAFAAPLACVDIDDEGTLATAHDDDLPVATERVADASIRHEAACSGYCDAFARACDRPLAYSDARECLATCDAWALGEPGVLGPSVACHAAMVPGTGDAFGSCIAAGPDSPICADV